MMESMMESKYQMTPAVRRRFARRLRVSKKDSYLGIRCLLFSRSEKDLLSEDVTRNRGGIPIFFAYAKRWSIRRIAIAIARDCPLDSLAKVPIGVACGTQDCVRAEHLLVGTYSPRRIKVS